MSSGKLLKFLAKPRSSSAVAAPFRSASSTISSKKRSVWKFGGSSVGSSQAFKNCAGVILASHEAGNEVRDEAQLASSNLD